MQQRLDNYGVFDKVYQLHDHGRDAEGEVKSWGRNSRLDNLQAAILNHRIADYAQVISRRRAIASMYQKQLEDMEELQLPPAPDASSDHFDIYQNYELQADHRDELKLYLHDSGIGTLVQWGGKAVHQWEYLGFLMKLPKVERFFERCIMFPMNMFINDDDVNYVCEKVRQFYRK